jgi:hypothetical protein
MNWENIIKDSETDEYKEGLARNIEDLIYYLEEAISGGQVSGSELKSIFDRYEIRFYADQFRNSTNYN